MTDGPRGHGRGLRVARPASCSTRPRTACTPSRRSSSPRSADNLAVPAPVTGPPSTVRRRVGHDRSSRHPAGTPPLRRRKRPARESGEPVRPAGRHGADRRQHHRRRHLQPADVAGRLRPDHAWSRWRSRPSERSRSRCCSRRCRGGCRPTAAPTRTRGSRSATRSGSRTPGRTGSPPGPATPRSRSAGSSTSRTSSTRTTTGWSPCCWCWSGCGSPPPINLSGVKNMGSVQVVTTVVKFAVLAFMSIVGLFYIQPRQLHAVERQRREHDRRDRRRHGDRAVQLPGRRVRRRGRGEGARPRPQRPPGDRSWARSPPRWSTCCRSRPCSASCRARSSPSRARRSPTPPTRCSAAPGPATSWPIAVIISGFGALNGWTMICAEMPLAAAKDGLFPPAVQAHLEERGAGVRHRRLHRARLDRHGRQLPRAPVAPRCSRRWS